MKMTLEVNKMTDMIRRKLNEAKKSLAKIEKDVDREPPKERNTKDMSMGVPEVPPDTFKPDEQIIKNCFSTFTEQPDFYAEPW